MRLNIRTIAVIVFPLITINSCGDRKENYATDCIKLNNEGIEYLNNYPMNGEKGLERLLTYLSRR